MACISFHQGELLDFFISSLSVINILFVLLPVVNCAVRTNCDNQPSAIMNSSKQKCN